MQAKIIIQLEVNSTRTWAILEVLNLTFSLDSISSITKMPSWLAAGAGRTAVRSATSLVVEVSLD